MPRTKSTAMLLSACLVGVLAAPAEAHARVDQGLKLVLDGQYWFCQSDPTGWTLADMKAVCSQIEPGGKGEVVPFIVDRDGKVRRKPLAQLKRETRAELRPTLL